MTLIDLASRLREVEKATAEAGVALREELGGVHEELSAMGAQTREVFAAALGRLAGRIERAEARNAQLLRRLRVPPGDADQRSAGGETGFDGPPPTPDLKRLVTDLSLRVDALEQGREDIEGRFERIERGLQELSDRFVEAEQPSTRPKETAEPGRAGARLRLA